MKEADLLALIGRRVAQLRHERKLTQHALGDRAGIGGTYVARIEGGTRGPSLPVLAALADALHVEPWELLTDRRLPDDPTNPTHRKLLQTLRTLDRPDLTALTALAHHLSHRPRRQR